MLLLSSSFFQVFGRRKFLPFFPILLMMILIAGFRYKVGKDYVAYEHIFKNISSIYDFPLIEIGFKYIVLFLKSIELHYLEIFFIMSIITFLLYYKAIVEQTKYTFFAFFLFFNTYMITSVYSGLRQGLAMGIFLFLLNDIYKRNIFKVFLGSIIAFSIHITGILILIIYFIPRNINIKKLYIIVFVICSFIFVYIDISKYFIDYFPLYIQMKFIDYSEDFSEKINIIRVLQRVVLIIPFLIYYDLILKKSDKLKYFLYIYLIGFFIYMIFSFNLAFATKINQFFRVLEIIMFPMLLELIRNKTNKIILFILIVIWSTLILKLFLSIPENYPYRLWNVF
jgi:hypothetical protein